jgi:hypothetical protein
MVNPNMATAHANSLARSHQQRFPFGPSPDDGRDPWPGSKAPRLARHVSVWRAPGKQAVLGPVVAERPSP